MRVLSLFPIHSLLQFFSILDFVLHISSVYSQIVTWYQSLEGSGVCLWALDFDLEWFFGSFYFSSDFRAMIMAGEANTTSSDTVSSSSFQLTSVQQIPKHDGYHTTPSAGNSQRIDTPVQVFTHTLSPMLASPQQMVHSGFNVSVPTQGALMSHAGSVHQISLVYATSQAGASHAGASHQKNSTVPQQPMVADLGDDSEYHLADHMQDIGTREVSQEFHSDAALDNTESQQQNSVPSQQPQQRVNDDSSQQPVNTDRTADHVQHTDVDIHNVDVDIQSDGINAFQPLHVYSDNDIHEELFPEDAQVTDEIVTEVLQGDNAMVPDGVLPDGFY
ncbi:hypothetical protein V6N11_033218 [Hibiscus sabdariffa]|uniref:Uncharacterized protein n=1 Tax=Hibiscus sabdariffa TaxID=183260 RepID=A0ABR2PXD5_9ROSI